MILGYRHHSSRLIHHKIAPTRPADNRVLDSNYLFIIHLVRRIEHNIIIHRDDTALNKTLGISAGQVSGIANGFIEAQDYYASALANSCAASFAK